MRMLACFIHQVFFIYFSQYDDVHACGLHSPGFFSFISIYSALFNMMMCMLAYLIHQVLVVGSGVQFSVSDLLATQC